MVLLALGLVPGRAHGQIILQDLVFTGGVSGEGYRGNLAAVTVPAVDSTDQASAGVMELGIRGALLWSHEDNRTLNIRWDGGLRQFMAGGFRVRDYAPREWVGSADLGYDQTVGSWGELRVQLGVAGRQVDDRPPMPLFIQPGYGTLDGSVGLQFLPLGGIRFDSRVLGEYTRYETGPLTPQMALLDREVVGAELGASWARSFGVRAHAGFRVVDYPNQRTFDPSDPFRRDRMFTVGATVNVPSPMVAQLGLEGVFNRSNSSRPEYDAIRFRGVASAPLPMGVSLNLFAVLTTKGYLEETEFARLVPGEEADNASVVYAELARPVAINLDSAVRFGWTRAETDIGDSYFERFGVTFLFHYRPWER